MKCIGSTTNISSVLMCGLLLIPSPHSGEIYEAFLWGVLLEMLVGVTKYSKLNVVPAIWSSGTFQLECSPIPEQRLSKYRWMERNRPLS